MSKISPENAINLWWLACRHDEEGRIKLIEVVNEIILAAQAAVRGLREVQSEQKPWIKHNFGDRPSWMPLLGAVEELGELAHAHLKAAQGIRLAENHEENAKDAVGDIIVYLCDYCTACDFDIQEIVMQTWDKVKQRDWKKDPIKAAEGDK